MDFFFDLWCFSPLVKVLKINNFSSCQHSNGKIVIFSRGNAFFFWSRCFFSPIVRCEKCRQVCLVCFRRQEFPTGCSPSGFVYIPGGWPWDFWTHAFTSTVSSIFGPFPTQALLTTSFLSLDDLRVWMLGNKCLVKKRGPTKIRPKTGL